MTVFQKVLHGEIRQQEGNLDSSDTMQVGPLKMPKFDLKSNNCVISTTPAIKTLPSKGHLIE
jgi:hypothetical protein